MKFRMLGHEMWDMSRIPPGLGLYTLRNETKIDFFGTLEKVANMGYKTVEFMSYEGIPAIEVKKALEHVGLQGISSIIGFEELEKDLNKHIEYSLIIGSSYLNTFVSPAVVKEKLTNESELQKVISALKRMGKEIKRHGLQFGYHPHAEEFEKVGGKSILDRLLEGVGSDLMKLELDLYWAKKAGLDPKRTLLSYKGRVPLIHVKDMDKSGTFTEVGHGIIDWQSIFPVLREAGVKYYFVEQDISHHPLESVKMSIDYLKSIGIA